MPDDSLITRHRPNRWKDVVGYPSIVQSLRAALEEKSSRAFLFTGPSGTGKTTLSRLAARQVGSFGHDLIEVDGARIGGVDDMRALLEGLRYRPLGSDAVKSIIIDECHRVSPQGFDTTLKMIEEPPEWVYWFFCTTDLSKVPKTIQTRCTSYTLAPLGTNTLFDFLMQIAEKEAFGTPRSVLELCAKEAGGSPRMALRNLSVCAFAEDRAEAARLLLAAEEGVESPAYELAKALNRGDPWKQIQPLFKFLEEQHNESVRHVVRAYFTKVLTNAKDESEAVRALRILDHFSEPFNQSDGLTPVVLAVGRILFARPS